MNAEALFAAGKIAGIIETAEIMKWFAPSLLGLGILIGLALGCALARRRS